MNLAAQRSMAVHLQSEFQISERRACQVLELSRSSKRRKRLQRWAQRKRREIYRFLVRLACSTVAMCQSDLPVFLANAQIARISTDRALAD